MIRLLAKTRQLNRMLQQAAGQSVNFMEMAEVLSDIISANVYVISRKGKILGYATIHPSLTIDHFVDQDRKLSERINRELINIDVTTSTGDEENPFAEALEKLSLVFTQNYVTVIPIVGGRERIGTLLITRESERFEDADFILLEYGATIVGMEILKVQSLEAEQELRSRAAVQVAIGSLSFSESEAVELIFEELDEKSEGLLVASKIADRAGITRSVIVNALRKLESAGVIETKSLGMKGTYIKILNHLLLEEFEKRRTI